VEKGRAKRVMERWDIPTPAGREFKSADELTTWEHFPAIVKPVSQHCSVGVTRDAVVHDIDALRQRIAFVNETIKEAALVEQFVVGREINVGIWGNGRPRVLPLREIDFSRIEDPMHRLVTWDSKWTPDSHEWNSMPVITDVKASNTLRARIEEIVLRTYRVFECRDYARVDLRIGAKDQPYVVDVNPNPDITADGGFIGACKAAGYTYGEAISNIVQMAVARRNRRQALFNTLQQRKQQAVLVGAQ
jgi:D-alanine-D-alanine ligase